MRWNTAVDAFAFGCVLAEMWSSKPLFPFTDGVVDRMMVVDRVLGGLSEGLAQSVKSLANVAIVREGNLAHIAPGRRHVKDLVRFGKIHRLSRIEVSEEILVA